MDSSNYPDSKGIFFLRNKMTGMQLFWTIVMIIGIILLADAVVGGAILAALMGGPIFLIAGLPQLVIGSILAYFGWKFSK
jgi:hypothetical protein